MRCASISATVCSTRAGSRPSVKQAATRSSKRILRLVRRNSRPPPSLLIQAPSNWATTRREKWWANAKLSWLHSVMRKAVSFSGIDFVSTPQLCLKTRPFSTVNYSWLFTTGEKSGLERLEDERDLKLIPKARREKTIPWKVVKKKLGL